GTQQGVVAAQTGDPRALVQANNPFVRTVGYLRATQFLTVDMDFTDVQTHRVSFYFVDFEPRSNRAQRVEVVDPTTGQVFNREDLYNFQGGKYLTYDLRGHVQIRITRLAGVDAVLSGI